MKILIASLKFDYLSGSPLHAYELSRVLAKRGHQVTVASAIGGVLEEHARRNGVELVQVSDLYKLKAEPWDLVLLNQPSITAYVLSLIHRDTAIVQTCHSEWNNEDPYPSKRIRRFVAIRPSIKDRLVRDFRIPEEKVTVIWNGVDFARFNRDGATAPAIYTNLFVGTVDHLREAAALDLLAKARKAGHVVRFIGKKFSDHLDGNTEWSDERWDIETEVKRCTQTAGVLLGRTTIEGWACGKPGFVYDIDLRGQIRSVDLMPPPEDMTPFSAETMADEYLKLAA